MDGTVTYDTLSQLNIENSLPAQTLASSNAKDMSSSGASSPDRSHSSHDSFGDSDTDMSSSEPEWEFQERPATETGLKAHPNVKPLTDLPGLPTELHFQIFRYLDDIDSTCLGLSNSKSYSVYRAIHGTKVRLNTGRNGPNPMERAWEIVGKTSCAHCGNFRCQLFQHIKTWMPEELEYCQMTLKFGSKASDGARDTCYRGKPSKPNRCGRHPIRSTTRHQDDYMAMIPDSQK